MLDTPFSLPATRYSIVGSVYGDKGAADLEPDLHIATEMHDSVVNITPQISSGSFELGEAFTNEIANFVDAGLGRAESVAPVGHRLETVKIREASSASAHAGRAVQLSR